MASNEQDISTILSFRHLQQPLLVLHENVAFVLHLKSFQQGMPPPDSSLNLMIEPPWQPVQTVSSPHFSQQPASPRQPSDTAAVVLPVMSSNLEIDVQFINIQYTINDIRRICLQATPTSERTFILYLLKHCWYRKGFQTRVQ